MIAPSTTTVRTLSFLDGAERTFRQHRPGSPEGDQIVTPIAKPLEQRFIPSNAGGNPHRRFASPTVTGSSTDQGAHTLLALHVPHNSSIAVPGPYLLPHYRVDVIVVETNKMGTIPVRGAGYPQGCFAMERLLDAVAHGLGLDRAEVRRRNLVPGDRIPYELPMKTREGTPIIYESGDFPTVQRRAMEAADYAGFPARRAQARTEGRYLGLGIANMTKVTGRGPFETALVRIGRSGQVMVFTGAIAMGQGTKTTLAQICAGIWASTRRTSR